MESEAFEEIAREKGLSKAGYEKHHTSLFERKRGRSPLAQERNNVEPKENISLPLIETPSKMSAKSNQKVAYSEISATPEKSFSPMERLFREDRKQKRVPNRMQIEESKQ